MKLYFLFAFFFLGISTTQAASNPTVCTMEYAPVCGSVQVQCIQAPCPPIKETFGNMCTANAAGAMNITLGECDNVISPSPIGGQKDIHGCLTGAGYRWNSQARQCLRPWESKVRILTIASEMKPCVFGMMMTECLQKRTGVGRWSSLYGGISGFDFVPGNIYRLLVLETKVENPPADGSSIEYSLLRILSKKSVVQNMDMNLLGEWYMIGYNDMSLLALSSIRSQDLTLSITKDRFSARICNSISGNYKGVAWALQTSYTMSTKMACQNNLISTMEDSWNLDGATYTIASARQMSGSTGPSIWLTITTKAGNIFTYTRR